MKRCPLCHGNDLERVLREDSLKLAGRTFSHEVPATHCRSCGETYFHGPDLGALDREVAATVAREGPCAGETFKYLRKALGMRAADLAGLLDLAPETLSRWETGQRAVDRACWLILSVLVLEHLEGRTTTLDRLEALAAPPRRARRLTSSKRKSPAPARPARGEAARHGGRFAP